MNKRYYKKENKIKKGCRSMEKENSFMKFLKEKWYWVVGILGVIIFAIGGFTYYNSKQSQFADTNKYLAKTTKVDLSSVNGNFQNRFHNGIIIKQIDTKQDLMKTTYIFNQGIIPTGKCTVATVEKVKIHKVNGNQTDVKPTGELIALSASSNDLDKVVDGFKNKQEQTNKCKTFIAERVANVVNGNDKQLVNEVKNNLTTTENTNGKNILWLNSGKMKHDLTDEYQKGTTKDNTYTYSNAFLISNNHEKVRNANTKVLSLAFPFYSRYNG